jgi:hypothetical protein
MSKVPQYTTHVEHTIHPQPTGPAPVRARPEADLTESVYQVVLKKVDSRTDPAIPAQIRIFFMTNKKNKMTDLCEN